MRTHVLVAGLHIGRIMMPALPRGRLRIGSVCAGCACQRPCADETDGGRLRTTTVTTDDR